jgi:hypothetical protein
VYWYHERARWADCEPVEQNGLVGRKPCRVHSQLGAEHHRGQCLLERVPHAGRKVHGDVAHWRQREIDHEECSVTKRQSIQRHAHKPHFTG